MEIYLVDGTYELFRHYYALPSARDQQGREVAAVRGVLASILGMMKAGATHVAVATDHVIESFRNECGRATRLVTASSPNSWRSFRCLKKSSPPLVSSCGPWSSLKQTTRSPPPHSLPASVKMSAG